MRRAVLTVGGTVAGLVALFSYKTHVPGITPVAEPSTPAALSATAPPTTTGSGAASSPSASPVKPAATKPAPGKTTQTATTPQQRQSPPASTQPTATQASPTPTPAKAKASPSASSTPKPATQSFQGSSVSTQYGPVQVAITVTGGKITNAGDVQQPSDSIGVNAVQQLNQEVLTAQSANIQAVSGATYTSDGYIQSLQQAVDQAGL